MTARPARALEACAIRRSHSGCGFRRLPSLRFRKPPVAIYRYGVLVVAPLVDGICGAALVDMGGVVEGVSSFWQPAKSAAPANPHNTIT